MSNIDRRRRIREYKETPRSAGVYRVRNAAARKSLIGATPDLSGMLNRQRFQLENGSHPDKELQRDWSALGSDNFEFEILDKLEPSDEPTYDPTEDLASLKNMWIEKLVASGETLYPRSRKGS